MTKKMIKKRTESLLGGIWEVEKTYGIDGIVELFFMKNETIIYNIEMPHWDWEALRQSILNNEI